jgi:hypothetical protein
MLEQRAGLVNRSIRLDLQGMVAPEVPESRLASAMTSELDGWHGVMLGERQVGAEGRVTAQLPFVLHLMPQHRLIGPAP